MILADPHSCDNEIAYLNDAIEEMQMRIAELDDELNLYKNQGAASSYIYSNDTQSASMNSMPPSPKTTCQRPANQVQYQVAMQQQNPPTMAPFSSAGSATTNTSPRPLPVCLCGVENLQQENMRLRQGLVAKHNEVVHLRGLMMNPSIFANNVGDNGHRHPLRVPPGVMIGPGMRLHAGGVASGGGRGLGGVSVTSRGSGRSETGYMGSQYAAAVGANQGNGMDCCPMPCCSRRPQEGYGYSNPAQGGFDTYSPAVCDPSASATEIIQESKRQMEQTENEIKNKLKEIKDKKTALEEDISKLQQVLIAKQQAAATTMQSARAVKAYEMVQSAQMAIELQKQQRVQAQEAAKGAMALRQAQDEQSRKQARAAKAAEMAQRAQYDQLMLAGQAAAAAERAEEAQKEQASQADEAAKAAEAVKVAQEQQNRLAVKQLRDAEKLKTDQEEQACKMAQASEALHAAHVAQVSQQAQACQATKEAEKVLTQHKYLPQTIGCEETERGMRLNMDGASGIGGMGNMGGMGGMTCCNPNCPSNN